MTGIPAYVRTPRMEIVAANALCQALYGGALDDERLPLNLARYLFLDAHSRGFFLDWDAPLLTTWPVRCGFRQVVTRATEP
jgi:MmyB-like transcription regulator ligand binding domain